MIPSQLKSFLEVSIPERMPILLTGAPGVGKTDIVSQAAKACEAEFYPEFPAIGDPTDGKGVPFAGNGDGVAKWLQFERHKLYCSTDKLTVVLLDDLGQAPPAVQASYMQWILARRIGDVKVSPEVCFIACTNRRADRAGVAGLLEPVKSRFATIINLDVDVNDWVKWALSHNIPTELITYIRYKPDMLHKFEPTADLVNSPCPRTVANVGRLYAMGIPAEIEQETYTGAVGSVFAAEFLGFLRIFRTLPNPDLILQNPETAPIPEDPATKFAICGVLAKKASQNTIGRLVKYFNRLPGEFGILAMRDSVAHCTDIVETRDYIQWATDHQDVII